MSFEDDCIIAHNKYRKLHQACPLKKKNDLTRHAQMWANQIARTGIYDHSSGSEYGENIAMTSHSNPTGEQITKMWYDEIDLYSFKRHKLTPTVGHFTQLVWRETTHIGVGKATGPTGTYVVANYEPAGNITNPGYFQKNVLPPIGGHRKPKKSRKGGYSEGSSSDESTENSAQMPEVGTKVETRVREFTDDKGRLVKETTTITTTTTVTPDGATTTSTNKQISTEYTEKVRSEKPKDSGPQHRRLLDDVGRLGINDEKKDKKITDSAIVKFREECLARHNELRKRHGAPSLKMNKDLEKQAQKWAEHLLKIRSLQHSDNRDTGENVAYKFASNQTIFPGSVITDMWYDEIKKYNFNNPGFTSGTGHFTQVVWHNSKEIGVGVATDGRGTLFAVANYLPAGNFHGQFEANVKPPRS